jgi:hypothetical protein
VPPKELLPPLSPPPSLFALQAISPSALQTNAIGATKIFRVIINAPEIRFDTATKEKGRVAWPACKKKWVN